MRTRFRFYKTKRVLQISVTAVNTHSVTVKFTIYPILLNRSFKNGEDGKFMHILPQLRKKNDASDKQESQLHRVAEGTKLQGNLT